MNPVYAALGCVALVFLAYLLARAASIGYFRTRAEYERSKWRKLLNGDEDAQG